MLRNRQEKDTQHIQQQWEHAKEQAALAVQDLGLQEVRPSTQRTVVPVKSGSNFAARTRLELMDVARRLHIPGRNSLSKRELISVIENRRR